MKRYWVGIYGGPRPQSYLTEEGVKEALELLHKDFPEAICYVEEEEIMADGP